MPSDYRGRFAPSPSGPLHLGSLLTALASFLDARAHGGQWLLRIDDLDPYRTQPDATTRILHSLEQLGLHWDGPIVLQSQQLERYRVGLESLQSQGLIYACTCSRRQLAADDATGIYPGNCRDQHHRFQDGQQALRLRTDDRSILFDDQVQGRQQQILSQAVGDFVLYRRDGAFAYHLATVLDDAEQRVTHIVRGCDLLDSTPRQIYLQSLLTLPLPVYAHTPILVDAHGQKLSKRLMAPEAETRQPGAILAHLLDLLRHPLPCELTGASVTEILSWATSIWDLRRLRHVGSLVVNPRQFAT